MWLSSSDPALQPGRFAQSSLRVSAQLFTKPPTSQLFSPKSISLFSYLAYRRHRPDHAHQTASAQTAVKSCWCPGDQGYSCSVSALDLQGTAMFEGKISSGRNHSSSKQETGHSKKWRGKNKPQMKETIFIPQEQALQGLQVLAHAATYTSTKYKTRHARQTAADLKQSKCSMPILLKTQYR